MRKSRMLQPTERSLPKTYFLFAGLLLALSIFALCYGIYKVPVSDTVKILLSRFAPMEQSWEDMAQNAVLRIRLPRVCGAILIGFALALAGSSYQSIFHNPLVSPDLLGVSNGACIGAACAILCRGGMVGVQLSAFAGGIVAVALTTSIPRLLKKKSTVTLVLSGVIVSGLAGSIMGIVKYVADPESELAEIVYWQMGSLSKVTVDAIVPIAPVMLVCIVGLLTMRWRINVLSLDEHEMRALGVNCRIERGIVIVFATILTASSVCLAGTISWVGLAMPHLARSLVGSDSSRMLPVSGLLSACFMLVIDTLARGLTGSEIPTSILTGIIGAPFFAFVLAREASIT